MLIPFLFLGLQKRSYRLVLQSVVVASPYLLFNVFGYFSTGLFPVREIAYSFYWSTPDFLLSQVLAPKYCGFALPVEYSVLLLAELFFVVFPFFYAVFRRGSLVSSGSASVFERRALEYWAFSLVVLAVILFYSFVSSLPRYAVLILPLYWVSALVWEKFGKVRKALLGVMVAV